MDTPQLTPELLDRGLAATSGGAFGPAADGGWWGLGLPAPDARVFDGIPMSADDTGARQLGRLHALGYEPEMLPELRDIDTIADAHAVADLVPGGRFATALMRIGAVA